MGVVALVVFAVVVGVVVCFYFRSIASTISDGKSVPANLRAQFEADGFIIIPNVYSPAQIREVRREIEAFHSEGDEASIVDFVGRGILPLTAELRNSQALHAALRDVFGGNDYRFCAHNDIGYGRVVGWHKDRLNGEYRAYERLDPFVDAQRIVKVAVYLQDHTRDSRALHVVRGSHRQQRVDTKNSSVLQPKLGSVVVFDQRLTHRGGHDGRKQPGESARILVSFGFGRDNAYTDQFEEGTRARQTDQLQAGNGAGVQVL
jgi:hypothetical protein